MSIFDRLNRALEGWRTTPEAPVESDGARVDRLMSAVGRSVETLETNASLTDLIKEDQGWYRVQALNATLDIGEQERTVIQRLALYFNTNSPLAVHMLDAVTSHVIGGCVQFDAKNEDLERALKEFWDDPDNHMSEDAIKFGREFIGNGELALPIFPGANTGLLKLGYIHPLNIKEIKTDPNNSRKFTELIERAKPGEDEKVWTIVNGDVTPAEILAAGKNYLLYFPLQRWAIGRGRPLLESSYYWIHHIQQFLGDRVKINAFLKAWSWWIKMTGADATQVNAKITQMSGGLPPGGLYVSNDEEELTPLSPSINAGDAIPDLIALLKYAAHSCSLPAHWIGAADDVNRSTADSASDPTIRFLEVLQKQVMEGVFLRMLNLQRDLFIESGYIPALKDDEMEITIEQPDLTPSDNQKKADAVAKVTSALVLAIENKLTDLGTGQTLWHNTAGMEVPENLDGVIADDMTEDVLGIYKSTPTPDEVAAAAAKLNTPATVGQNGNGKASEAYNPNQPRVKSGADGGQWTSGGGVSDSKEKANDTPNTDGTMRTRYIVKQTIVGGDNYAIIDTTDMRAVTNIKGADSAQRAQDQARKLNAAAVVPPANPDSHTAVRSEPWQMTAAQFRASEQETAYKPNRPYEAGAKNKKVVDGSVAGEFYHVTPKNYDGNDITPASERSDFQNKWEDEYTPAHPDFNRVSLFQTLAASENFNQNYLSGQGKILKVKVSPHSVRWNAEGFATVKRVPKADIIGEDSHYLRVQQALDRGEDVPDAVLKDYPKLKKKTLKQD
jgi:hypothetical protein